MPSRWPSFCGLALLSALGIASSASGQDDPHTGHASAPISAEWRWSGDGNVFFGYNYQKRLFADFSAWESQNWLMGHGERTAGPGALSFLAMISFEPFTIPDMGSPQLFQTGEAYKGVPLVNYQHPHDLLMGLGASYRIPQSRVTYLLGADLVGSPALGPTPFMHRNSGRNNPQVPITHHFLDSTHITAGVLTGGVQAGLLTFDASVFRGAEPDDRRFVLERPGLDSWSARIAWQREGWRAQLSGGRLHNPSFFEPYDVTKLTASLSFDGRIGSRPLAATVAWGQNRDDNGFNDISNGYLLEWDLGATPASTIYGRAEQAQKALFGLGGHPPGFGHPHFFYDVTAFTTGYLREIVGNHFGRIGVGADVTLYRMPSNLEPYYGSSSSYHLFLRWRPLNAVPHVQ